MRRTQNRIYPAACLLVAVVLAACSEQAPPPPPPPSLSCLSVPRALLRDIEEGLTLEGTSLREGRGHAALAWERSFFVAAEVDGPDLDGTGDVGVWLVTGLVEPGAQTIQAVPGLATRVSDFEDSSSGSLGVTEEAAGIAEARACLTTLQAD